MNGITVLKYKWKTPDALEDIIATHPYHVLLDGTIVRTGERYNGYADDIPYGESILVRQGDKKYGFKKRTNNTIEVM